LTSIRSDQTLRLYVFGWVALLLLPVILLVIVFIASHGAERVVAVLFFGAFALVIAWQIARVLGPRTRAYLNFGTLRLELWAPPLLGGQLKGIIRLPREGSDRLRIDEELSCLRQMRTSGADGTWVADDVLLRLKDVVAIQRDQAGRFVEVRFAIPATAGASGEIEPQGIPKRRRRLVWKLRLAATDPGGDLERTFPLQVLPAPAEVIAPSAGSSVAAAVVLVAANLVPLALVLTGKASISGLVLLYWAENVVIGFYNVLRMLAARRDMLGEKIGAIAFFCAHYGLFCLVHGVFVIILFSNREQALGLLSSGTGLLPLVALVVSHGVSFVQNYLRNGRYLRDGSGDSFWRPYPRMLLLHVMIFAGAFFIQKHGSPLPMLIGLIAGKTVIDLLLHQRANR
jgi:hypothetical protein